MTGHITDEHCSRREKRRIAEKVLTRFQIIAKILNSFALIWFQRQYGIVIARPCHEQT